MAFFNRLRQSTALLVGDTLQGARMFFLNTFVITGLFVAGAIFLIYSQPDLRYFGKVVLINLINRATYLEPSSLSAPEYRVATWISKRYRVALEPVSALVKVAFVEGEREQIDPALILAVMCIESGVHPYAQSPVGADGLMQVMTTINAKMYERYGGTTAAYDPVTNLRVGIQILKMLIKRRGSVEEALKFYVGAGISGEDGGYVAKVLQEQVLIQQTMLRPVN
jgi:soluble lytic murein transglycosylase-like protein